MTCCVLTSDAVWLMSALLAWSCRGRHWDVLSDAGDEAVLRCRSCQEGALCGNALPESLFQQDPQASIVNNQQV